MSNQSGSAFWTCAVCGGMGSALDSSCPNCGAARGTNAPTTQPAPVTPAIPVITNPTAPVTGPSVVQQLQAQAQSLTSPTCSQCGASNSWVNAQCSACGATLQRITPVTTPRQRMLAAVLAFVGGVVGAQYFYMGRYAAGVMCVALCWTGYSIALGAIHGIRLLMISDAEFARECVG